MIKKIALITTLFSTLAYADMSEKGFFVGADVSTYSNAETAYSKKGTVITTANYQSNSSFITATSLKMGYQYYFTRVYMRVNNSTTFKDETKNRFKIASQVIELNADYLPLLFKTDDESFTLKGLIGVGVGANKSALKSYSAQIDVNTGKPEDSILNQNTQWLMEYGGQLGFILNKTDSGLSFELAYRYRSGLMTQFTNQDDSYQATFKLMSSEFYLGANYMF